MTAKILNREIDTPYLRTFDITYSSEMIKEKVAEHALSFQHLQGEYQADLQVLSSIGQDIEEFEKTNGLHQLFLLIGTWPAQVTQADFDMLINKCIAAWVDATKENTQTKTIQSLFKAIRLTHEGNDLTSKFYFFMFDIITESIMMYQDTQIQYILNYDGVTNLPNQNLLVSEIEEMIETEESVSLSLFSIRFEIERGSTTISPIIPTSLSLKVVELLGTCFPEPYTLYQTEPFGFAVMVEKKLNDMQSNLIVAKIHHCFEKVINLDEQAFLVSPIIGSAIYEQGIQAETYYKQAHSALNHAIYNQKNWIAYDAKIEDELNTQKQTELDVTTAFNNEDLELYLQPIVGLPGEHCVGAEVLLRWPNAKNRGIYPNIIVEIINKVGLGKQFTRWLINSVCRLAGILRNEHNLDVYLTLNLLAQDLYDVELPHLVLQSSQLWKIEPKDIILEITENGILEESDITLNTIDQITKNGFKLALDDFGTGYSSMSRLRTLPISLIKIDQSFVRNIVENKNDYEMVLSMAHLANSLDKEVLVEGVETQEALDLVNKIGIKKIQGYHYAKPMPFDEFVTWTKNKNQVTS